MLCSILQIKCAYYPCFKNLHGMHALLFVWEDVLWNINIIFLLTKTHTQLLPHGTPLKEGNRKQVFPKIELTDLANKQDAQFNLIQINDKYFLAYSMQHMGYICTIWHLSEIQMKWMSFNFLWQPYPKEWNQTTKVTCLAFKFKNGGLV